MPFDARPHNFRLAGRLVPAVKPGAPACIKGKRSPFFARGYLTRRGRKQSLGLAVEPLISPPGNSLAIHPCRCCWPRPASTSLPGGGGSRPAQAGPGAAGGRCLSVPVWCRGWSSIRPAARRLRQTGPPCHPWRRQTRGSAVGRPVSSAASALTWPTGWPGSTTLGSRSSGMPSLLSINSGQPSSTRSYPVLSALLVSEMPHSPVSRPVMKSAACRNQRACVEQVGACLPVPEDFGQAIGRTKMITQFLLQGCSGSLDLPGLRLAAPVVVHHRRAERPALPIDRQDRPGGGIDAESRQYGIRVGEPPSPASGRRIPPATTPRGLVRTSPGADALG